MPSASPKLVARSPVRKRSTPKQPVRASATNSTAAGSAAAVPPVTATVPPPQPSLPPTTMTHRAATLRAAICLVATLSASLAVGVLASDSVSPDGTVVCDDTMYLCGRILLIYTAAFYVARGLAEPLDEFLWDASWACNATLVLAAAGFLSCRPLLAHAAALTVAPIQFVWYVDVSVALATGGRQWGVGAAKMLVRPGTSRARRVMSVHHLLFLPLVLFATRRQPFPPPSQAVAVGTLLVLTMLLTARLLSPRSVRLRETGHTYLLNIQQAHHVDHKIDGWLLRTWPSAHLLLVGGAWAAAMVLSWLGMYLAHVHVFHTASAAVSSAPAPQRMWSRFFPPPPPLLPEPAIPVWGRNCLAALSALVLYKVCAFGLAFCVRRKLLLPATSRKVGHVLAGCVWVLLYWNLFDASHWTWKLNVLVPVAQTLTFILKGAILRDPHDPDVLALCRTGAPYELLLGPLCFALVMDVMGLYFFRTQVGALMMSAMCVGDGVAPLAGAHGTHRYQLLGRSKTLEGSAACFVGCMVGSAVFLHALGLPAVPLYDSAVLALVATLVEAASPSEVDNLLMPLSVWWLHSRLESLRPPLLHLQVQQMQQMQNIVFHILCLIMAGLMEFKLLFDLFPFNQLNIPVSSRLFGANKMIRGFVTMPLANALSHAVASATTERYSAYGTFLVFESPLVSGAIVGLVYRLAELPNSFIKRRLGIEAGGSAQSWSGFCLQFLTDHLDSTTALVLLASYTQGCDLWTTLKIIPIGVLAHMIGSRIVKGGKRRARGT